MKRWFQSQKVRVDASRGRKRGCRKLQGQFSQHKTMLTDANKPAREDVYLITAFIISKLHFSLLPRSWRQRLALCISSRPRRVNKDDPGRIQLITLLPSPRRERLYLRHSSPPPDNSISRTPFTGRSGTPLLRFPSNLALAEGLAFQISAGWRLGGWIMYVGGHASPVRPLNKDQMRGF